MQNKVYQVFTHKDLDGVGSLLTFLWSKPDSQISFKEITNTQIDVIKEFTKNTFNLPNILIFDLAIRDEFLPELDNEKITFIDHHINSRNFLNKFKKSKIIFEEELSNTFLLRKILKNNSPKLTDEQKKLILYIHDYESKENKYKESYDLNILFWTLYKNNFNEFVNFFKNGFVEFNKEQTKIIKNAKDNALNISNNLRCYIGDLIIEGKLKKVLATSSETFNVLVDDLLIKKHKPDLFFNINIKSEKVSLKQSKSNNEIDLLAFCKKYCEGQGNNYSCKGNITPLFMELTKKFKPL